MALIVAILLGGLALAFVLYPLYKRAPQQEVVVAEGAGRAEPTGNSDVAESEAVARSAIQEVEFDYQLGNLEEPDYRDLRERYMQRALVALRARYEREQEIDDEIEEQLRQLKESYEKTDR
jgi:hypothetical protein